MPDPEVLARLRALIETGQAGGPGPQGSTRPPSVSQSEPAGAGVPGTEDTASVSKRGTGAGALSHGSRTADDESFAPAPDDGLTRPGTDENDVPGADGENSVAGADHGLGPRGADAAPRDSHDDPVARGHDIALRLLTVRDRTTLELRTRLARKQIPDEAIDEVLERLARVGLLDDAGFARQWVDQSSRRHVATGRLRRELRTRGVCDEDAQAALAGRDGEQDRELAEDLVARKLRSMGHLPPPTRYRRLAGLLTRRGFPASVIASVLADLPDQPGQGELGEQDA